MSTAIQNPAPTLAVPVDAKTLQIVADCNLAAKLSRSVCLACAKSTLAQDSQQRAILYCSGLFRDLQAEIVNCTGFTARPVAPVESEE